MTHDNDHKIVFLTVVADVVHSSAKFLPLLVYLYRHSLQKSCSSIPMAMTDNKEPCTGSSNIFSF